MSADNYTECPNCHQKNKEILESLYGKISEEEYIKKREKLYTERCNFREDYEIGITDGEFEVSYLGYCYDCKYEFKYSYKSKVEI